MWWVRARRSTRVISQARPYPDSPLSSLPASDPPVEEINDSLDGDLEGGSGNAKGGTLQGGGDGDAAPTPGLCLSPIPCR